MASLSTTAWISLRDRVLGWCSRLWDHRDHWAGLVSCRLPGGRRRDDCRKGRTFPRKMLTTSVLRLMSVDAFERIGRMRLGPKAHVGTHVGSSSRKTASLESLGCSWSATLRQLVPGGLGIVFDKCSRDGRGQDAAPLSASVLECVAHEVHATARPAGMKHFCGVGLVPSCVSEIISLTRRRPRRASFRENAVQNAD